MEKENQMKGRSNSRNEDPAEASALRRRRSPKGDERREQILLAAMKHFADDGYQSASFAAIAQEVGLSLPGLIHYFPSKVDLLLAILARRDAESGKVIGPSNPSWRALLQGLVDVVKANTKSAGVVRTFAILNAESLTRDHPAATWFAERARAVSRMAAQCFSEGIAKGEIRSDVRPDQLAAELISMMDGLQMLWLRTPGEIDMVAIFNSYIDRLIAGIEIR
ncbi:TetR/AcrR family transcriptional regulator [Rhizobium sp. SGZ-381]|uniref:TetR/AcrR family transcriptional regulator n=1 Tax=Rhizobium sp. SGZ-381 TaxID=3342800 RepID=UPI0036726473